jgi:hypothetical protein
LRIFHLHAEHVADLVPDVFGRDLDAARREIAEIAELAHGFRKTGAQAVDMRAALFGGNQVDVAFLYQLAAFGKPQHRPVDRFGPARH